jgi:type I restriction enzyme S subunit
VKGQATSSFTKKRLKHVVLLRRSRVDGSEDDRPYIGLENIESWTGKRLGDPAVVDGESSAAAGEGTSLSNAFEPGDVLFGKLRPYLAKAWVAEFSGRSTTELLVMQPVEVESRFLRYVCLWREFVDAVDASTFGSKMPRADWDFIGNLPVPIPDWPTQRAIADYLDRETARIDALIAAKERVLALLAEKRRALITRAVTKGLDPNVPLRDSGIPWLGEIPAHWKATRLKFHLHRIEQGWSPQCEAVPAGPDDWGVLKAGCVNGDAFNPDENKRLPDHETPLPNLEIRPGDVLMSRANTTDLLGSAAIVHDVRPRLLLCDKLYRLDVNTGTLLKGFLVCFLRTPSGRFDFERTATGASNSMQNISQEVVRNVWLPVPPWTSNVPSSNTSPRRPPDSTPFAPPPSEPSRCSRNAARRSSVRL